MFCCKEKVFFVFAFVFLFLGACGVQRDSKYTDLYATFEDPNFSFDMSLEYAEKSFEKVSARSTIYYLPRESDSEFNKILQQKRKSKIYDDNNNLLVDKLSSKFVAALTLQGSGIIDLPHHERTGVVTVSKEHRYEFTEHPFGLTSSGLPVIAYRSVAIDLSYWRKNGFPDLSFGAYVYIPATDGMVIPEDRAGRLHNGVWQLMDIGGAIKKDRIDLHFGSQYYKKSLRYIKQEENFPEGYVSEKARKESRFVGSKLHKLDMYIMD